MNALTWFEIPVTDLDRAQRFYEGLLGKSLRRETLGPQTMAIFPYEAGTGVGGCLAAEAGQPGPAREGTLVYLAVEPTLDGVLERLPRVGGQLLLPKESLPNGLGVFAHIVDSEGNRVGLHAPA